MVYAYQRTPKPRRFPDGRLPSCPHRCLERTWRGMANTSCAVRLCLVGQLAAYSHI